MSDTKQALKDDNEITDTEVVDTEVNTETEADTETNETIEIVLEGEEKPSSKSVPFGVQKRFKKLTEKVEKADAGKSEAEQKLEVANAEIELLKMGTGNNGQRPDEDDFETRTEYLAADESWINDRIEAGMEKSTAAMMRASQENTQAVQRDDDMRGQITKHYKRAEALKMPNYEELEDKAIDALGNDFAKQIMANSEQSELIMGHLGANPAKAEALKQLAITDPLKAYTQALELGGKLSRKSNKEPAPDPETVVDSGSASISALDKRIEAAREKAAQTKDMGPLLALKRQKRELS